jgi:large subunit ribosomal protein L13
MKIIDGKNAAMGRLASYVAKQLLKGEEIILINTEEVIITGSKKNIREEFLEKRKKVGSGQQGPKISRENIEIVKRAIRGMLPNPRLGRGKVALKRLRCYEGIPKEYEDKEKISAGKEKGIKFVKVKNILK